ncbi:MAG: GNAT family N-acetyltransferase [Marinomonas sp.]
MGKIRNAELDDAPHILSIFQQGDSVINGTQRNDNISLIDVMDWLENATDKHPMLVFEEAENIIAWCSIEPFYGLPAFDTASEISLYVSPQWQAKGIGKKLIQYLEIQQASIGFTHLVAYIYASNTKSQTFFEKQTFQQWGSLPKIAQQQNEREDVYLYGKIYGASDS